MIRSSEKPCIATLLSKIGKAFLLSAVALVAACSTGAERDARREFVTSRLKPALSARDRAALADLLVAPDAKMVESAARQRSYFETVETAELKGVATRLAARFTQLNDGGIVGLVTAEEVLASRVRDTDIVDDVTLARRIEAAQFLARLAGLDSIQAHLDGAEVRVGDPERPALRFRLSGEAPDFAIEPIS